MYTNHRQFFPIPPLVLLAFSLSPGFSTPLELGEDDERMDTNPIITRLLREIHTHTDRFRTLPKSLYPSVALLKRYRDSDVLHAIKLTEHSAEDRRTTLAIVTPTLANAYFNLAQFAVLKHVEENPSGKVIDRQLGVGAIHFSECIKKNNPDAFVSDRPLTLYTFETIAAGTRVQVRKDKHTRLEELPLATFNDQHFIVNHSSDTVCIVSGHAVYNNENLTHNGDVWKGICGQIIRDEAPLPPHEQRIISLSGIPLMAAPECLIGIEPSSVGGDFYQESKIFIKAFHYYTQVIEAIRRKRRSGWIRSTFISGVSRENARIMREMLGENVVLRYILKGELAWNLVEFHRLGGNSGDTTFKQTYDFLLMALNEDFESKMGKGLRNIMGGLNDFGALRGVCNGPFDEKYYDNLPGDVLALCQDLKTRDSHGTYSDLEGIEEAAQHLRANFYAIISPTDDLTHVDQDQDRVPIMRARNKLLRSFYAFTTPIK